MLCCKACLLLLLQAILPVMEVSAQQDYAVEKLGAEINTAADEITPLADWDGKVLYFTRTAFRDFNKSLVIDSEDQARKLDSLRYYALLKEVYSKIANAPVKDPVRSPFNQDIWIANSDKAEFDKIVHPPTPLNNALPNSISTLMPQLRTFVVINQFIPEGGMDVGFSVVKQLNDSTWTFPEPLQIDDFYTRQSGTSINMSSDGKVMILGLSRKDAVGDLDLYYSLKKSDGQWSAPTHMGEDLNSRWRESTPFLSLDMKRLYFSSNRPGSLGGMDLFYADRLDDSWTRWSEIRHYVWPINSEFDDSQPFFNYATGYLYFTSKREGSSDIYRVRTAPPMPLNVGIAGSIINSKDSTLIDADVIFHEKGSDDLKMNYSREGKFSFSIPKGKVFRVYARKSGFISSVHYIEVEKYQHFPDGFPLQIELTPIESGEKIALKNLYFKQSEPEIIPESYDELNYLSEVLKADKNISIQVEGHTDNSGNPEELLLLSEKRAAAIRDYLVRERIKPERISIRGFGGSKPVFLSPVNEQERRANRRVEVRIVRK